MSYTTIQVKRTNNKTLDDSSLANIIPAYGEIVFSHTSGKDEFVIGDNSTTIPNLPRLNMQAASNMSKFDGNKLTLGDNTHQGSIELYDGSNNKTTIVPSSTSNDITVTLPSVGGTLVTTNNVPDERVTIENNTSSSNTPVYPTYYTNTSGSSVKLQADDGYKVITRNGTTSSLGASFLYLGNNKASGASGNKTGGLYIYSRGTNPIVVQPVENVTQQRTVSLPDADGVIALVGGDLGAATASTPTAGDSSTKVATTAFVNTAISNNTKVALPTSAPSDNIKGQLYIDPTTSILYYNSANTGQPAVWKPIVGVWG